ncbi:MAG: hypothetical protein K1Y36_21805, partial [Blastocatellia bacterium]|nr:hypothetical protein [Blastocatellia bacterium]
RLLPLLENVWRSYQPIPANQAGYRSLLPQLEDAWTRFVTRAASPETRPENDHSATGPAPEPAPAALPAATADVPCAGEQPPTPVPAARLHQRREATPAEQKFYAAFAGLTNELKAQGQILANTFPTARGIAKHAWLGSTVPHPASFLKILADLALLPAAERQKLWPWLEPVLTTYRAVKETSREFGPVAEALAAAEAALMPSTTAELPEPLEPVTGTNPTNETALDPQTEPAAPEPLVETSADAEPGPEPPLAAGPAVEPESGQPEQSADSFSDPLALPEPAATYVQAFDNLGQFLRAQYGALDRVFPAPVKNLVQNVENRVSLLMPTSFVRVVWELARLPLADRQALWPQVEPVLAAYRNLRGKVAGYRAVQEQLASLTARLAEVGPIPAVDNSSRKPETVQAAEYAFYSRFVALERTIRLRFGTQRKIFSHQVNVQMKTICFKGKAPTPATFLKILTELAQLPLLDRQALWPQVEPVLELYLKLPKPTHNRRFLDEFELLAGKLAER